MQLSGRIYNDVGVGLNGATITVYPANSDTPTTTATTGNDSHSKPGYWQATGLAVLAYRVKIEYNGKVRWLHGETATQFSEVNVGTAVQLTGDGNLVLVNPNNPTDGSSVDSPSITLTGAYDSDATAGVTRTNKSVTILNDVADDGTYKLSIKDTTGTEKASVNWAGAVGATDYQIGGKSIRPTIITKTTTALNSFSGWNGIITQEVILTVRSIVQGFGRLTFTSGSTAGAYSCVMLYEAGQNFVDRSDAQKPDTSHGLTMAAQGSVVLDAGTYTFALFSNGYVASTLDKSSAFLNHLHLVIIPTAS